MDKNICLNCNHERNEHDLFRGCMHWNCSCMKSKEQIDKANLEKENEELKQKIETYKEAAEFFMKRDDDLYKKYKEHSKKVDIKLDSLKEKLELLIVNYNLMQKTLEGIIRDYSNPNMTYFNAASRAFDCLYQIQKSNEEKEVV